MVRSTEGDAFGGDLVLRDVRFGSAHRRGAGGCRADRCDRPRVGDEGGVLIWGDGARLLPGFQDHHVHPRWSGSLPGEAATGMSTDQRSGRKIAINQAELYAFLAQERICRAAHRAREGRTSRRCGWSGTGRALWLYPIVKPVGEGSGARFRVAVLVDAGYDYSELPGAELCGSVERIGDVPRTGDHDPVLDEPERLFAHKYTGTGTMRHDGRHVWLRLVPDRQSLLSHER